jgi:hypothetical protein
MKYIDKCNYIIARSNIEGSASYSSRVKFDIL